MPGPLKRPQKGMFSAARKEPLSDSFTRIDRDHNNHDKDIEIRDDVTEDEDYIEEVSTQNPFPSNLHGSEPKLSLLALLRWSFAL